MLGDARSIRHTLQSSDLDLRGLTADQLRAMLLSTLGRRDGSCVIVPADQVHMPEVKRQPAAQEEPYDSQWSVTPKSAQQDQSHCAQPPCTASRRDRATGGR